MSAENGIYILKTNRQYRVLKSCNIEQVFDCNGDYKYPKLVEYFKHCRYTNNAQLAINIAQKMLKNDETCEYGICVLPEVKFSWKEIIKKKRYE